MRQKFVEFANLCRRNIEKSAAFKSAEYHKNLQLLFSNLILCDDDRKSGDHLKNTSTTVLKYFGTENSKRHANQHLQFHFRVGGWDLCPFY